MNPYYPEPKCKYCPEKATRKFTGAVGFHKYLCPRCAARYREWYPDFAEEAVVETDSNE